MLCTCKHRNILSFLPRMGNKFADTLILRPTCFFPGGLDTKVVARNPPYTCWNRFLPSVQKASTLNARLPAPIDNTNKTSRAVVANKERPKILYHHSNSVSTSSSSITLIDFSLHAVSSTGWPSFIVIVLLRLLLIGLLFKAL